MMWKTFNGKNKALVLSKNEVSAKVQAAKDGGLSMAAGPRKTGEEQGSNDEKAPSTPALDRIKAICKVAAVDYPFALELLKLAKERNTSAHHAPPRLQDHLKPDVEIDWLSIRNLCEDHKSRLRDSHHAGLLTEARL
ncbi:hypothetical protein VTI74DRAFT_10783 [Chaetomium olivicolor]